MSSIQEDARLRTVPTWQSSDAPPSYGDDASSNSSGGDADDFMERDVLEKDVRFDLEDRLEDGDEGMGFIDGSRKTRSRPRRPRAFILALTGILLLAAALGILAAKSFSAPSYTKRGGKKHITMDHIFNGTFGIKSRTVEWVKEAGDGIFSTQTRTGDIWLEDASGVGENILLVNASQIRDANGRQLQFSAWKLSADMKYVMFKTDYRKQWRHSSFGNYYIHRLSDHSTTPLSARSNPSAISYVAWSPTLHAIAYVKENDIYVVPADAVDDVDGSEVPKSIRLTTDGSDTVMNGVPDWVYEEEVFSTNFAMWWSPESDKLAFLKSDETEVPEYTLQYYNPTGDAYQLAQYPKEVALKYPKPGSPNPLVSAHVFSLTAYKNSKSVSRSTSDLSWQGQLPLTQSIIMEVVWVGPAALLIKETDRAARIGNVVLFDDDASRGVVVRKLGREGEEGEDGWIDHGQSTVPLGSNTNSYLDIVPNEDGYNHIAMFSPLTSSTPIWLTSGDWEVTDGISGIDVKKGLVYFLAATPSTERHLYNAQIPLNASAEDHVIEIESMTDTSEPAYYAVSFSPAGGYYTLAYQGPDIPFQKLIAANGTDNGIMLEDNAALNETSQLFQFPIKSYTTVISDGVELNAVELLPPNFDSSGRKKYPVLFRVYGGPGSQYVNQKFERDWHHYLACEKKTIVVTVDGRGTGFKGRSFRNPVRDDLGRIEVIDQVAAAKEWAKKRYVDTKRIGIWGWSYGGFMTTKAIEADSGIFTLGMAVAPVTSWLFYDSIYTERYMNTPDVNEIGYLTSAVNNVTAFEHADFLLAHGSGDDNVNFQNSATLVEKFTQEHVRGWRFRMFTDSDHSMSGRSAYRELFEFLNEFLEDKWYGRAKH